MKNQGCCYSVSGGLVAFVIDEDIEQRLDGEGDDSADENDKQVV